MVVAGIVLELVDPVVEGVVVPRPVVGVAPQSWRLMGDAVHVEGVEPDLACHSIPSAGPVCPPILGIADLTGNT
jgi:hypothetical protein